MEYGDTTQRGGKIILWVEVNKHCHGSDSIGEMRKYT